MTESSRRLVAKLLRSPWTYVGLAVPVVIVGLVIVLVVSGVLTLHLLNPVLPPDELARASNDRYEIVACLSYSGTEHRNTMSFHCVDKLDPSHAEELLWMTRGGVFATIEFLDSSRVKLVSYQAAGGPVAAFVRGRALDSSVVQLDEGP